MLLKFVYARKAQVQSGGDSVVVVSSLTSGKTYSLGSSEFQLLQLFDGETEFEEILDKFRSATGLQMEAADLGTFVERLRAGGLLQSVPDSSSLEAEASRLHASLAPDAALEIGAEENLESDNLISLDEARLADRAGEMARASVGAAPPARAENWSAGGMGAGSSLALAEPELDEELPMGELMVTREPALAPAPVPAPPAQAQAQDESGADATPPLGVSRVLVPLPVRALVWLVKPVALPARSALLALAVAAGAVYSFYLLADLRAPLLAALASIEASAGSAGLVVAIALAVNLLVQLLRASGFQSRTGGYPPVGISLADGFIPRFQADLPRTGAKSVREGWRRADESALAGALLALCAATGAWSHASAQALSWQPWAAVSVVLTLITVLVMLNPLAGREGYRLVAAASQVPDLRERAWLSLVWRASRRVRGAGLGAPVPGYVLATFWLAAFAWVVATASALYWVSEELLDPAAGAAVAGTWVVLVAAAQIPAIARASRRAGAIRRATSYDLYQARGAGGRTPTRAGFWYLLILVGLVALGTLPYDYDAGGEVVILPAGRASVPPLIPGDIREIFIREGDFVEAGQVVGRLADDEQRAEVAVAESKIDELQARLDLLKTGASESQIALARQKVETAATRARFSVGRADRLHKLVDDGHVSKQAYEDARGEARVNQERLEESRRNLDVLVSGARPQEIEALEAEIAQEQANLRYAEQQFENTKLRAPISGRVVSGTLRYAVGEYLKKGEFFATIENTTTVDAEIRVPEVDIGEIHLGSTVRFKAWAFPNRIFEGSVVSIAPNAESSDTGRVVRVVTRIDNPDEALKSELTGYAKVRGSTQPAALAFTRMLRRFFTLELWSWIP